MKILTFTISFYVFIWIIIGVLTANSLISLSCGVNKDPIVSIEDDIGETGVLDFIGSAFNVVLFITTLGVSSVCGLPTIVGYILTLFNSIAGIAIIYLLRGTN